MTPWAWWAGELEAETYDLACECATREEAVQQASRQLKPGDRFQVVEARSSTSQEHTDFVPFLRTRNYELVTVGPMLAVVH